MNVGSVSGVVNAADLGKESTMLVAKKALNVQKQQGEAIVQMIEAVKVAGPKGNNVDVVA
jgi:hypothetical protein